MTKNYQICKRCIMDTTDPEIKFDRNGFCNHCKKYYKEEKKIVLKDKEGTDKLAEITAKIKKQGKNKEYDCIIGVSGGVDSSYVACKVKELGLRPLAVHLDNGWDSELAVENVHKLLKKLDIDLYTHVIDWESFKDLQLSFMKASVANMEIPTDHAITALVYKTAIEKNIKYIISGSNFVTEGILPSSWGYNSEDLKHLKAIHKKFGNMPLKDFPSMNFFDQRIYYKHIKKIKIVTILNYITYNKKKVVNFLEREYDWKNYGGKHYESIFTRFFQGYILPRKFGYDKRKAHLSTLVCSGQITREEALETIKEDPYPKDLLKEDKEFVLKKLGLSDEEFEKIMALPLKSYKDYPNDKRLYDAYRLVCEGKNMLISRCKKFKKVIRKRIP